MIGIIGGSSLKHLDALQIEKKEVIRTPFGIPSAPLILGTLHGQPIVFLARHGLQHTIPPHLINYRANMWALHHIGCKEVLAFSAMCSISADIKIGDMVIPDQLIDYTWDREATFFNSQVDHIQYTEFADPYAETSRQKLITAANRYQKQYHEQATYGVTQGPRYETRAEIRRYQNDGCNLLGMTGMPEAILAQEIQIKYAVCGLVTNINTGKRQSPSDEIGDNVQTANEVFQGFLATLFNSDN